MSLTGVLKAGLAQRDKKEQPDSASTPDWTQLTNNSNARSRLPKKHATDSSVLGLSDTFHAPEIKAKRVHHPANVNQEISSKGASKQIVNEASDQLNGATKLGGGSNSPGINPNQFVRELDRFQANQNRFFAKTVLMDVTSEEIAKVTRLTAQVRGRYIAKLLEAGDAARGSLKQAELAELRHYRDSYQELCHGLDILKNAIGSEDISVTGMMGK